MSPVLESFLASSLWPIVWQTTVVSTAALLLARCFRLNAAARHVVLLAALACILAGPALVSVAPLAGLSLDVVLPHPASVAKTDETAAIAVLAGDVGTTWEEDAFEPFELSPAASESNDFEFAAALPSTARQATASATAQDLRNPRPVSPLLLAMTAWVAGTCFLLVGIGRSWLQGRRLASRALVLKSADYLAERKQAAAALGTDFYPPIGLTNRVSGPTVVGLWRPIVLFPPSRLQGVSSRQIVQLLIHEGAHAMRRDPLVLLLERVACASFWWHPLVHAVCTQLDRAREEICDNFVLNHTDRSEYGGTLLHLATSMVGNHRPRLSVGILGRRWKLEHRVRDILNQRRKTMTRVRYSFGAVTLTALATLSVLCGATRLAAQDVAAAADNVADVGVASSDSAPVEESVFNGVASDSSASNDPFDGARENADLFRDPSEAAPDARRPTSLEHRVNRIERLLERLIDAQQLNQSSSSPQPSPAGRNAGMRRSGRRSSGTSAAAPVQNRVSTRRAGRMPGLAANGASRFGEFSTATSGFDSLPAQATTSASQDGLFSDGRSNPFQSQNPKRELEIKQAQLARLQREIVELQRLVDQQDRAGLSVENTASESID